MELCDLLAEPFLYRRSWRCSSQPRRLRRPLTMVGKSSRPTEHGSLRSPLRLRNGKKKHIKPLGATEVIKSREALSNCGTTPEVVYAVRG